VAVIRPSVRAVSILDGSPVHGNGILLRDGHNGSWRRPIPRRIISLLILGHPQFCWIYRSCFRNQASEMQRITVPLTSRPVAQNPISDRSAPRRITPRRISTKWVAGMAKVMR